MTHRTPESRRALPIVVIGLVAIVVAAAVIVLVASACAASASSRPRAVARETVTTPLGGVGLRIVDNRGNLGQLGTPLEVDDWHHDPMAWVNLQGLWSGGNGQVRQGGNIYVSWRTSSYAAMLAANGTLTLRPCNASRCGRPETLTPRMIAFLAALMRKDHGHA